MQDDPRTSFNIMAENEPILVIGTGNAEYVLDLESELRLDQKHEVKYYELFGGSGVNYTMRLMRFGIPVFPILPVGKDTMGIRIRDEILNLAGNLGIHRDIIQYIGSDAFFIPDIQTQKATILVESARRTIFSEQWRSNGFVNEHVKTNLARYMEITGTRACPVMIGHIHSDHPDANPANPGECTRHIIESLGNEGLIFCNFGTAQICLGADAWKPLLQRSGVLQLNLAEIKALFQQTRPDPSLFDIFEWLRRHEITAVITLERFGAIGTYKGAGQGLIFARPIEVPGLVDPTGAGDAFGAGLMSKLFHTPDFSFEQFQDAIETARIWSAYACTQFGGSSNCPDRETLRRFQGTLVSENDNPIDILTIKEADLFLRIFDVM